MGNLIDFPPSKTTKKPRKNEPPPGRALEIPGRDLHLAVARAALAIPAAPLVPEHAQVVVDPAQGVVAVYGSTARAEAEIPKCPEWGRGVRVPADLGEVAHHFDCPVAVTRGGEDPVPSLELRAAAGKRSARLRGRAADADPAMIGEPQGGVRYDAGATARFHRDALRGALEVAALAARLSGQRQTAVSLWPDAASAMCGQGALLVSAPLAGTWPWTTGESFDLLPRDAGHLCTWLAQVDELRAAWVVGEWVRFRGPGAEAFAVMRCRGALAVPADKRDLYERTAAHAAVAKPALRAMLARAEAVGARGLTLEIGDAGQLLASAEVPMEGAYRDAVDLDAESIAPGAVGRIVKVDTRRAAAALDAVPGDDAMVGIEVRTHPDKPEVVCALFSKAGEGRARAALAPMLR